MLHLLGRGQAPEWDEEKHDIDEVFAFLCYRGVNYAKWVFVGDIFEQNWKMRNPRQEGQVYQIRRFIQKNYESGI